MKTLLRTLFVTLLVTVLFTACSTDSNPLDPNDSGNGGKEPDPVLVKTPRYMRIESISVKHFPKNKSNGDTWDWDPFSSTERKPDIEVVL